jgi:mono/diheme cytochrome c family protein
MIEKYVDTQELNRLLSLLIVVLGCLIIAGLFASLVVPGMRNANRPSTPAAVAPAAGESGWLNPEEFPPRKGSVIPPVNPEMLLQPSTELVTRGKELFEANCVQCHGQGGHGDGPAAVSINPKPRDLAGNAGWKNGPDEPGIFKTLSEGIKGSSMSAFDFIPKKDRMALVHYVRALAAVPPKGGDPQAIEILKKQLASAAETIPNRIPVSRAIEKIRDEYRSPLPLDIDPADQSSGGRILRKVVADPNRAGRFLAQSQTWKKDYRSLASVLLPEVPENGFEVATATLSESEWQELYAELMKRIKL